MGGDKGKLTLDPESFPSMMAAIEEVTWLPHSSGQLGRREHAASCSPPTQPSPEFQTIPLC